MKYRPVIYLKMNDIIIFGTSPYINDIKKYIPKLQKKYTTIGINMFPAYFPNVDHWFFYDDNGFIILKEHYKGQKIHTRQCLKGHLDILGIKNFETFKTASDMSEEENTLFFCNFTITLAIHWCIKNGFKNIYLAGIDMDSDDWFHFYNLDYANFTHHKYQNEALKWIYDLQEYINIYQLNPNNTLKLPKKDIKELLK